MSDALSFLWLNVVGALLVMGLSLVLQPLTGNGSSRPEGVVKI
jgi:hypothetical protein